MNKRRPARLHLCVSAVVAIGAAGLFLVATMYAPTTEGWPRRASSHPGAAAALLLAAGILLAQLPDPAVPPRMDRSSVAFVPPEKSLRRSAVV